MSSSITTKSINIDTVLSSPTSVVIGSIDNEQCVPNFSKTITNDIQIESSRQVIVASQQKVENEVNFEFKYLKFAYYLDNINKND
jgi:hypothetical protein